MNRTFGQLARAALDLGISADSHLLGEFVAKRDDTAFAQLVRRHGPMVLAVCRRVLRHQQDAEDAFQATFLVLARKAEDVWPREAVGAWLHGVAYRVAMKARGVRARQTRREHPLQDVSHLPPDPLHPDLTELLDRAIRKLPDVYRAAVVACDLEGRTRKDAADVLGWKEGTLSGRLARARQLLAARLRKAGLVVPVGTAFTDSTADALPAALAASVVRAALGSHAAGVSAPVAALTEGVVRSMFLTKLKTAAVGVLAACVMGVGVWSASGQGPGTGSGERPRVSGPSSTTTVPAPTDFERLQGEWIIGRRYIENNTYLPAEVRDATAAAAKKEGSLVTVNGTKMDWPLVEASSSATTTGSADGGTAASATTDTAGVKVTPRFYTINLDPTQSPKHIDMTDAKGRVTQGIYKFEDGYFMFCVNMHGGRPKGFSDERDQENEPLFTLWQPRPPANRPAEAPDRGPRVGLASQELDVMIQDIDRVLAQKKGDPAALERLRARADAARSLLTGPQSPPVNEDDVKRHRIAWAERMVKLGYMSQAQLDRERATLPPPSPEAVALSNQASLMTAEKNVADAAQKLIDAQVKLDRAKASSEVVAIELSVAQQELQTAKAKLAESKQAADKVKAATKTPPSYSLHVRTPLAAETAVNVQLGSSTALDGYKEAAKFATFAAKDVNVWVVRDGKVLAVDIVGITAHGVTTTNYQLKAWDMLFVQVNAGK